MTEETKFIVKNTNVVHGVRRDFVFTLYFGGGTLPFCVLGLERTLQIVYTLAGMEALKKVSDEDQAQQIGHAVVGIRGDVSKMADLDRLFAQIKQEAGRLDKVFALLGSITSKLP